MYVYSYKHMHITRINENVGHEFESEQEKVWREERKEVAMKLYHNRKKQSNVKTLFLLFLLCNRFFFLQVL